VAEEHTLRNAHHRERPTSSSPQLEAGRSADVQMRTLDHPATSSAQPQQANGSMDTSALFSKHHDRDNHSRAQHEAAEAAAAAAAAAAAHGVGDGEHERFNGFTQTPPTQELQEEPFAPPSPEFTAPAHAAAQVRPFQHRSPRAPGRASTEKGVSTNLPR